VYASHKGRGKMILPDSREAIETGDGDYISFDISADPGETKAADLCEPAVAEMQRVENAASALARRHGLRPQTSTHGWQIARDPDKHTIPGAEEEIPAELKRQLQALGYLN